MSNSKAKKPSKPKQKPGPSEERLVIEGDWKDAVKKALRKKKPASGWPKPEPEK
jgi:hypothetical protein